MDLFTYFNRFTRELVLVLTGVWLLFNIGLANATSGSDAVREKKVNDFYVTSQKQGSEPLIKIPKIFQHAVKYEENQLVITDATKAISYKLRAEAPRYQLTQFTRPVTGNRQGLIFDFGDISGTLYFGLIEVKKSQHPQPVYFKKSTAITNGLAEVNVLQLSGKYDLSGWQQSGQGELGYRVLNDNGEIIFDGQLSFLYQAGLFRQNLSFIATPTVHNITPTSAVLAFETNVISMAEIRLNDRLVTRAGPDRRHEIMLQDLLPATEYHYVVDVADVADISVSGEQGNRMTNQRFSSFKTAPLPGSRQPFVFAYASDSRKGQGGGERDLYGINAYIMKKIMALSQAKDAVFLQFSGDLINGRSNNIDEQKLQYRNWLSSIAPFANQLPVYTTMGNHEGLFFTFEDGSKTGINIDRFPFATDSAEALFSDEFVLPKNGPLSEDGARYDPDLTHPGDFPPYQETVYSYQYDNVAMVVLNSNYLFSRSFKYWFSTREETGSLLGGGGLHGYIMDQQLSWLEQTLDDYQQNKDIDFIFVSQHTPVFPNGGHKSDDMWYYGSNTPRPHIQGKPLTRGIIEQRDRLLKLMDSHSKVFAILTGDEHNYARTLITPETRIHSPGTAPLQNLLSRPIWQINNGAAGAPYYAQETLPWSDNVVTFSMQHALVFIHVNGKSVHLEVLDPDTLSKVE